MLGQMLLEAGLVTNDQIEAALGRQRRFGGRIATNLLAMDVVPEKPLARMLARQIGVPFVVLSRSAICLDWLAHIPYESAKKHNALVIHKEKRDLFIALADPKSIAAIDELRFVSGFRVIEHGALIGQITKVIDEAYSLHEIETETHWRGMNLDAQNELQADGGHVEIVVGKELVTPPSLPTNNKSTTKEPGLEGTDDWVSALQSGQEIPCPQTNKTLSVMVIDDEDPIRDMLGQYLTKQGYDVTEYARGNEALQSLQHRLPDAIVLDAMLPGVHGFDLCHRLKQAEATKHIPVIMISAVYRGWRYADDVKKLYGADAFLEKPLRLDELAHNLKTAISERNEAISADDLSTKATLALQAAANAYKQGDLMGSAHHLQQAVEAAPFCAQLHYRLGLLYDKLSEAFRAIASLERAVQLDPSYQHVLALARVYEKTGFTHKAFEAWERCLRSCDESSDSEVIKRHMDRLLP